ncbi:DUF1702 family protein [Nonomuraea insulae]|uniref:DUF1702 family protein n=1 Tax=Nonomuraea insulae TaxID=1616787 RepID=A0ABW1DB96_9ACTN
MLPIRIRPESSRRPCRPRRACQIVPVRVQLRDGRFPDRPSARSVEPEDRGFAFEGAGMACALQDTFLLSRGRRTNALLTGLPDAVQQARDEYATSARVSTSLPRRSALRANDQGGWSSFMTAARPVTAGQERVRWILLQSGTSAHGPRPAPTADV